MAVCLCDNVIALALPAAGAYHDDEQYGADYGDGQRTEASHSVGIEREHDWFLLIASIAIGEF
jgi:hypothetical protein